MDNQSKNTEKKERSLSPLLRFFKKTIPTSPKKQATLEKSNVINSTHEDETNSINFDFSSINRTLKFIQNLYTIRIIAKKNTLNINNPTLLAYNKIFSLQDLSSKNSKSKVTQEQLDQVNDSYKDAIETFHEATNKIRVDELAKNPKFKSKNKNLKPDFLKHTELKEFVVNSKSNRKPIQDFEKLEDNFVSKEHSGYSNNINDDKNTSKQDIGIQVDLIKRDIKNSSFENYQEKKSSSRNSSSSQKPKMSNQSDELIKKLGEVENISVSKSSHNTSILSSNHVSQNSFKSNKISENDSGKNEQPSNRVSQNSLKSYKMSEKGSTKNNQGLIENESSLRLNKSNMTTFSRKEKSFSPSLTKKSRESVSDHSESLNITGKSNKISDKQSEETQKCLLPPDFKFFFGQSVETKPAQEDNTLIKNRIKQIPENSQTIKKISKVTSLENIIPGDLMQQQHQDEKSRIETVNNQKERKISYPSMSNFAPDPLKTKSKAQIPDQNRNDDKKNLESRMATGQLGLYFDNFDEHKKSESRNSKSSKQIDQSVDLSACLMEGNFTSSNYQSVEKKKVMKSPGNKRDQSSKGETIKQIPFWQGKDVFYNHDYSQDEINNTKSSRNKNILSPNSTQKNIFKKDQGFDEHEFIHGIRQKLQSLSDKMETLFLDKTQNEDKEDTTSIEEYKMSKDEKIEKEKEKNYFMFTEDPEAKFKKNSSPTSNVKLSTDEKLFENLGFAGLSNLKISTKKLTSRTSNN